MGYKRYRILYDVRNENGVNPFVISRYGDGFEVFVFVRICQ